MHKNTASDKQKLNCGDSSDCAVKQLKDNYVSSVQIKREKFLKQVQFSSSTKDSNVICYSGSILIQFSSLPVIMISIQFKLFTPDPIMASDTFNMHSAVCDPYINSRKNDLNIHKILPV